MDIGRILRKVGAAIGQHVLLIGGVDATGKARALAVNEDGEPLVNLEAADIQIGAVEIKNADTDDRVNVADANTERTTGTHVLAVQHVDAAGGVLAAADLEAVKTTTGAVADAAVTAGATGTVSAKLRAISRDIGALLSSGITVSAMDLAGIAESTVPTIGTDGVSSKLWVDLFGRLAMGGYDQTRGADLTVQAELPLGAASPVLTVLDAVSSTQESAQFDFTGYSNVALWLEAADSGGGTNLSVQVKRALAAGDTGANWGSAVAIAAAGQTTIDLSGVVPGLVSVAVTRTTGTLTVKALAQR